MSSLKAAEPTMGKIKVCISTSHNIKSLLEDQPATVLDQRQSNQALSNNFNSYTQSVRNTASNIGEEYLHNPYPSQRQTVRGGPLEGAAPSKIEETPIYMIPQGQSGQDLDVSAR